jgi:hypothetical protein
MLHAVAQSAKAKNTAASTVRIQEMSLNLRVAAVTGVARSQRRPRPTASNRTRESMATRHAIRHQKPRKIAVWIVDGEQWPRACLCAELIERGLDGLGFITLQDAVHALSRPGVTTPDILVFDSLDQHVTKEMLDSVSSLGVPTILVSGNSELELIRNHSWSVVLTRPTSLGAIADEVQDCITARDSARRL